MIDNFCVLVSTIMCLVVIVRAVQLDRILPWFQAEKAPEPKAEPAAEALRAGWRADAAARRKDPG
jgi:hypothetical protein